MIPVDIDRNGSLDLVATSLMGPVSIQLARCVRGHWLEVSLEQAGGNREALGASVYVESPLGVQWRTIGIGSTGAHSGREPDAHFGLGADTEVRLRVRWPDGEVTDVGMVAVDQRIQVER